MPRFLFNTLCYIHVFSVTGEEARRLFDDAQTMLSNIINQNSLTCCGALGFWRANSVCDDIQLYREDDKPLATFYGLRQQVCKLTSGYILWFTPTSM